jgi:uncharacterized membrane protein
MRPTPYHYFPISPLFVLVLLVALAVVVLLIEFNILTYAYEKIGISRRWIFAVLLSSLLGSAINVPIAEFPARAVKVERVITLFGMRYIVPQVEWQDRTILAINVGGAIIPVVLSIYLLCQNPILPRATLAVAVVAIVTHLIARPVPGLGIVMPVLLPPLLAALVAMLLDRRHAAPIAYVAGTMGTLIGADILNLHRLQDLGAPVVSIGGAGTSDGIFLTGIIAVLLA